MRRYKSVTLLLKSYLLMTLFFRWSGVLAAIFFSISLQAQYGQTFFAGLTGQPLLDSLRGRFKPDSVLPYNMARDTLYAKVIAIDDDTVRCIYSGHALYLDPTQDPTQYVYLNGTANGMNAEHSYPQSKGATGNGKSDMHHLFPTRIAVNEKRGSFPYADIPDAQTEIWYYKTTQLTSVPTVNKDAYSEYRQGFFEPRESAKGDVARAVFYFYTMYKDLADAADPAFFELQRNTLCQWHIQDPADEQEAIKTWRIAAWQENKPNPFILDCSLAFRTYCPAQPVNCLLGDSTPAQGPAIGLKVTPQPFRQQANIEMQLPFSGKVRGAVRNAVGQELARFEQDEVEAGSFHWPISIDAPAGPLFLEIHLSGKNGQQLSRSVPLISF